MKQVSIISGDNGFTLVELAIVLVIVGMLIGIGAGMMGPLVKAAKHNETKEIVNAAVSGMIGFGTSSNRIPHTTEFPSTVRTPRDSWNNSLYYIPDANLVNTTAGGICGRKTTSISIVLCPDSGCATPTSTISNIAFAVISGAANFNIQTGNTGGRVRGYNPDIPGVDNYAADMTRLEAYDDIVQWMTLDELRIRAGCIGAQLKIINNELPSGKSGSSYSASVYPDGGVAYAAGGKYRWCLQGSLPAGLSLSPNTTSVNCSGLAEGSWGQSDTMGLSGTPTSAGSFNLSIFTRDNNDSGGSNDNMAQRSYVITVNP